MSQPERPRLWCTTCGAWSLSNCIRSAHWLEVRTVGAPSKPILRPVEVDSEPEPAPSRDETVAAPARAPGLTRNEIRDRLLKLVASGKRS